MIPGTATTAARVILAWADNAIQDTWLQVIVKANANTGLNQRGVYYFGNVRGKVLAGGTSIRVTNADVAAVQAAVSGAIVLPSEARDVNKDRRITNADVAFVSSRVSAVPYLTYITIPIAGSADEG